MKMFDQQLLFSWVGSIVHTSHTLGWVRLGWARASVGWVLDWIDENGPTYNCGPPVLEQTNFVSFQGSNFKSHLLTYLIYFYLLVCLPAYNRWL